MLFVKRGSGKTIDGEDIPPIVISRGDLSRWNWKLSGRTKFKTVIAEWPDLASGQLKTITRGEGEPILKLRHRHASKDEATRAADGALTRAARGSGTLNAELGGFNGNLFAEGLVDLVGIEPDLAGVWSVSKVEHRLQGTLTTRFEAERDNEDE